MCIRDRSCLKCHGDPQQAPLAVLQKYGNEKGFGYKVGDIRGIISVKIKMPQLLVTSLKFIRFYQILFLALAFIFAYLFAKFVLVNPIKKLTTAANTISMGQLDTNLQLESIDPNTHNEIEQLTLAIGRLATSINIALKKMKKK